MKQFCLVDKLMFFMISYCFWFVSTQLNALIVSHFKINANVMSLRCRWSNADSLLVVEQLDSCLSLQEF